jgi:hypothetical protein
MRKVKLGALCRLLVRRSTNSLELGKNEFLNMLQMAFDPTERVRWKRATNMQLRVHTLRDLIDIILQIARHLGRLVALSLLTRGGGLVGNPAIVQARIFLGPY